MPRMERRSPFPPNRLPRVAIGGILHETNTFCLGETGFDDFAARSLLYGGEMIRAAQGTNSAPGGVIDAAEGVVTLVPTLFASAMPGAPVSDSAFERLASDLLSRLRMATRQWPGIDGVVLYLHGAMVTASESDADGLFLDRVREVIGPNCPLVAVIDSHANLSERMVRAADLLIGFQHYPHTDTGARGRDALTHCLNLIHNPDSRPVATLVRVPLLSSLLSQRTEPGTMMSELWDRAHAWTAQYEIASISLVPGFPFADVPDAGAAVLAYDWDHRSFAGVAARAADDLAAAWWAQRSRFRQSGIPLGEIPRDVVAPTVLAEISDNPGAGGTSDGTHLLRWLVEQRFERVGMATIVDPRSVAAAHSAGLGAAIDLGIGGKMHPMSGDPLVQRWTVDHLGNGVFSNEGAMGTGSVSRIGRTATLRTGTISVILSERRAQSLDPSVLRAGGLIPEQCQWIVVKSSVHYRAGFGPVARRMIDVECPGLSSSDLTGLDFARLSRPMYPLDASAGDGTHGMSRSADA